MCEKLWTTSSPPLEQAACAGQFPAQAVAQSSSGSLISSRLSFGSSRRLDLLEQLVSPLPVGTRFFDSRPQPYLHDKICRYHQCKNEGTAAHRSRRQINQQQMIVDCAECRIARRLTLSNMWRPDATIANVGVQVWQFGITSQIDPGHCTIPPILNRLRVDRESYPLLLINIQPAMLYSLKAALAR
jgi:hypothetical protein